MIKNLPIKKQFFAYSVSFLFGLFTQCFSLHKDINNPFEETTWEEMRKIALTYACCSPAHSADSAPLQPAKPPCFISAKRAIVRHSLYFNEEIRKINEAQNHDDIKELMLINAKTALWILERSNPLSFKHSPLLNIFETRAQSWLSEFLYTLNLLSKPTISKKEFCYCLMLLEHFYSLKIKFGSDAALQKNQKKSDILIKKAMLAMACKKKFLVAQSKKNPHKYIGYAYNTILGTEIIQENNQKMVLNDICFEMIRRKIGYVHLYKLVHQQFGLYDNVIMIKSS